MSKSDEKQNPYSKYLNEAECVFKPYLKPKLSNLTPNT